MTVSQQLESLGRALADRHLVAGAAGNISIMDENGLIYITARGTRLDSITDADVVCIQKDGSTKGQKAPTSEHLIHTSVYSAFPDIRVVAHTHSTYATAAAVLRKDIPPIVDEMTILLGGGAYSSGIRRSGQCRACTKCSCGHGRQAGSTAGQSWSRYRSGNCGRSGETGGTV